VELFFQLAELVLEVEEETVVKCFEATVYGFDVWPGVWIGSVAAGGGWL
jgi:hypothetical protein